MQSNVRFGAGFQNRGVNTKMEEKCVYKPFVGRNRVLVALNVRFGAPNVRFGAGNVRFGAVMA